VTLVDAFQKHIEEGFDLGKKNIAHQRWKQQETRKPHINIFSDKNVFAIPAPGVVAHMIIPNINDSLAHPQPVRTVHIDAIAFHLEQFWP
jgi:hypothetical protein